MTIFNWFNCTNIIIVVAGALAADSPKEVRIFERIYRQKLLLACKAMHDPKPNVNSYKIYFRLLLRLTELSPCYQTTVLSPKSIRYPWVSNTAFQSALRAFKPSLEHVSISQDILDAWNFNRAICWFCWELTICYKQKEINRGLKKKEEEDKPYLYRYVMLWSM